MSMQTLALAATASLLTSALYLYIGHVLSSRPVSAEASLANRMFVVWWRALGTLGLLGVGMLLLYMAGGLQVWMHRTFTTLSLLGLFLALWGLQFYLVYLYTGSRRSFVPLGIFYAVLFVATIGLMEYLGRPERIVDNGWALRTEPRPELGPAFGLGFLLLLVGPQIAAAAAYARLYAKTRDRTQRYRIALITGSIIVWFGSSLVATGAQVSDQLAYQLASRLIGIAAALAILAAYKPPAWIRRRYGIHGLSDEGSPAASPA
jgi:hypothetical protein